MRGGSPLSLSECTSFVRVKAIFISDKMSDKSPAKFPAQSFEETERQILSLETTQHEMKASMARAVSVQDFSLAATLKKESDELEARITLYKENLLNDRREALHREGFPDASALASRALQQKCDSMQDRYDKAGLNTHISSALIQIGIFLRFAAEHGQNFVLFRYEDKCGLQVLFEIGALFYFGPGRVRLTNSGNSDSSVGKYDRIIQPFDIDDSMLNSLKVAFDPAFNAVDYLRHSLMEKGFCVGKYTFAGGNFGGDEHREIGNHAWPVVVSLLGNTRNFIASHGSNQHLFVYQDILKQKVRIQCVHKVTYDTSYKMNYEVSMNKVTWLSLENTPDYFPLVEVLQKEEFDADNVVVADIIASELGDMSVSSATAVVEEESFAGSK